MREAEIKMNRRDFLTAAALAAPAVLAKSRPGASASARPLKVCVFSDLHYHPRVWTNTENTSFLEKIMARAERARCDMMIHCGDLLHGVRTPEQKAFLKLYNDFKIPGYHCLGNHDQDGNPYQETCEAYRMPDGHYSFDKGGFRFVIADPNYFCNEPGKFIHHGRGIPTTSATSRASSSTTGGATTSSAWRVRRSTGYRRSSWNGCAPRSSDRPIPASCSRTRASSADTARRS